MEFFTEVINVMKLLVCGFGAGMAVIGGINFASGHSQHNASKKEDGMGQLMGGGGIFLIGILLVPKLAEFFSI
ncbi:Maff2 family mobile element protein [Kineothrix sedimenti]|uniref:Maff2 family protein n=1 Tax=Kineothrix sedimenti TaxID=3123317 RepID=A0ABZ3ER80_9FIRM